MSEPTMIVSSDESDLEIVGDPTWSGKRIRTEWAIQRAAGGRKHIPVGRATVEERRRSEALEHRRRSERCRQRKEAMVTITEMARKRAQRAEEICEEIEREWRDVRRDGRERAMRRAMSRRMRLRRARRLVEAAKRRKATRRTRPATRWPAVPPTPRPRSERPEEREVATAARKRQQEATWPAAPPTPRPRKEDKEEEPWTKGPWVWPTPKKPALGRQHSCPEERPTRPVLMRSASDGGDKEVPEEDWPPELCVRVAAEVERRRGRTGRWCVMAQVGAVCFRVRGGTNGVKVLRKV
ncbi:uncharacterized protein [Drosophila bipectinata]|uniref:uncharacterized protein n=1 Tax=Drosophila bipectinata TaxID=42026 RepID=UPI0038B2803D